MTKQTSYGSSPIDVTLYSSPECCLCDDAMLLLDECRSEEACTIDVTKKNIYEDKSLLVKYKFNIPVLKKIGLSRELKWPFDRAQLIAWLKELD